MINAPKLLEQAASCREVAKRARRLGGILVEGPDRDCLLRYAEELEGRACGRETQAAALVEAVTLTVELAASARDVTYAMGVRRRHAERHHLGG
jgi:hypothetical protein